MRLRHTAIALNFSDINVRRGGFYIAKPLVFPVILGNEAAGIVVECGAGVTGIKPGTRINFVEEGDRIIFQPVTKEYIDSFCGVFKLKPGEKSVVQEHLEERRMERDQENRK